MKHFYTFITRNFLLLVLACSLGLMSSCSANEEVRDNRNIAVSDTTLAAYKQLADDITDYNRKFLSKQTRRGGWWRRLFIGLADAVGAAVGTAYGGPVGGATLGAAASLLMAEQTNNATTIPDGNRTGTWGHVGFIPISGSIPMRIDSLGLIHNKILVDLETEDSTIYTKVLPSPVIINKVLESVRQYGYIVSDKQRIQLVIDLNKLRLPTNCLDNTDAAMAYYKKIFPEYSNQLNIIQRYMDTVRELPDSLIPDYTEGFLDALNAVPIPPADGNQVVGSVIVGGNSTLLWKSKQPINTEP